MKFSATTRVVSATPLGSKIITTIEGAELENLKLTELLSKDRKCSECMEPLLPDEEVVIFASSHIDTNNEISIDLPYLIHVKNQDGKVCLEEFVTRLLQSKTKAVEPEQDLSKTSEAKIISTEDNTTAPA